MCLYPRLIKNRKYTSNKKNGGITPVCVDSRTMWVSVGCGKCMECMGQKSRGWKVRLQEDIKIHKNGKFATLTFSNESIKELGKDIKSDGYDRDNEIAKLGVRRFLERWRKKYGKSVRHWLVTELGHKGTENIHLHGIIYSNNVEDIKSIWGYGFVYIGEYCNSKTINYISKYVTKRDLDHKEYQPKILTSAGIGGNYRESFNAKLNKYNGENTDENYTNGQGYKMALPIYYRNGIYTDEEKEKLWLHKLDKNERWVCGERVDVSTLEGVEAYYRLLKYYQKKNKRLGYGTDEIDWEQKKYERDRRSMLYEERIKKAVTNKQKIS